MKKDPRINANSMGFRKYFTLYCSIVLLCGSHTAIHFMQQQNKEMETIYVVLSMLTYIFFLSLLLMFLFAFYRKNFFLHPINLLNDAARKVAQGDFSVRIPPQGRDGKKDEFEVLFEDFNAMTAELASTEVLKKDFISNVSHELKTPLSVIQNYSTILQSEKLSEAERQEYAQRIGEAAKRLTVLVTNILQISRLENQKIPIQTKTFNLSEQLCRCALEFEQLWDEKDISLDTEMDQNILINSDEELLSIVWNNLLSNALKFTEQGGNVRITAKAENGQAVVTVKDTGCGIDAGSIRHIFEKFYQADTSHAMQGNGLGLAMVQQIVTMLGGKIAVDSTPGVGSAFTVCLSL
ncbi:HAMP domain-containing sensor histidine kinase [Clostridium sp. Marseille-P2415]|uniref:HAMP domain-containing sensor histidine kinase n=1 Tax=Clostridium sp. Marseille-P2415 TaxID=1805471 RepID=UPI0009883B13|nr:HAMP domain-containing sensor histidine kinase [Clostridium sp. Marseille-P2415]